MEIHELISIQRDFDSKHISNFNWSENITERNTQMLGYLLLSLSGEVGEAANLTKKIIRGDFSLSDKKEELEKEIADIFIYVIKLIYQLDFDIEKVYFEKLNENRERFTRYEENSD